MKVTSAKGSLMRTPFLENQVSPEKLELACDGWRSQSEGSKVSPTGMFSPSMVSFASSSIENAPPLLSPAKSAKRWGMFGSKKPKPDMPITVTSSQNEEFTQHELTKKKSRLLKKKGVCETKPLVDMKSQTLGQNDVGQVNVRRVPVPDLPATPVEYSHASSVPKNDVASTQMLDGALYFTVDPTWDESKGDADLYLLPSPGAVVAHDDVQHEDTNSANPPRKRMKMHNTKPLRSIKSVVGSDNQTSFLFIE